MLKSGQGSRMHVKVWRAYLLVVMLIITSLTVLACQQQHRYAHRRDASDPLWQIGGGSLTTGVSTASDSDEEGDGEETDAMKDPDKAHAEIFEKDQFPSARLCQECHPDHYREWSASQHAYAQMSPIFNAMHGKILKLTNGTNGDFCIRCHTPVGMNLGEKEFMSNIDRHPTSREGVTCIVCHRVNQAYGKLSGRLHIARGGVEEVVYGPDGNQASLDKAKEEILGSKDVHDNVQKFFQLTTSGFCGSCHDVTLVNGFRLEEAFSEYKNSPAAAKGISCQDCHMGKEQGRVLAEKTDPDFERKNYEWGPAARFSQKETPPRKRTNHLFAGPDYSVLPPGLFPLDHRAVLEEGEDPDKPGAGFATIRQWAAFYKWLKENPEHQHTWGTFDDEIPEEVEKDLPGKFQYYDDRPDARAIVDSNLKLLQYAHEKRLEVLRNGYKLGDIVVERADDGGLAFNVQIKNGTDGHNVPTGFDAERLVWLLVRVFDADGNEIVHEHQVDGETLKLAWSGDVDPNGDLLDLHSLYVHNHQLPIDDQLFTLQSRFVVRMVRGGEREQVLAINYSPNPLPFIRPERRSSVLLGRPGGARKHKMGIEPNGHRWADYSVPANKLTGKGPYRAVVELKAAMVPVNLVNEIRDVGFDYDMSARDIAENLVNGIVYKYADGNEHRVTGHQVIWRREVSLHAGHVDKPVEQPMGEMKAGEGDDAKADEKPGDDADNGDADSDDENN